MIWTVPNFTLQRVTPKTVAAAAIVAGTNFTADGTGFEDGMNIVFFKSGSPLTMAALTPAMEGKNETVESAFRMTFRLKEKERPKRGLYDAAVYRRRGTKTIVAIKKKALKVT